VGRWVKFISVFLLGTAVSAGTILTTATAPAAAEKRVALVVGNGDYQHADKLANPVTDSRRLRDALTKLGFEIVYGENLDQQSLRRIIGRFANAATDADLALVYFAGHGATFGDVPYVVPVDAQFSSLGEMPYELVSVETLIGELRRAKGVRIAILDACRDNSVERDLKRMSTRGGEVTRGLGRVKNPEGLILAYATQYLSTAADGDPNGDSPFTTALLHHIATPGLDVKELFFKVGSEVIASTKGRQRPEISVSFYESYALVPAGPGAATTPSIAPSPLNSAAGAWAVTQNTASVAVLEEFIQQYGSTVYGSMARARLEELKKSRVAVVAPPVRPAVPPTSVQRTVLYEEDPNDPQGKRAVGSVVWRTDAVSPGMGKASEFAVRAEVEIPERKMSMTWTLRRETDQTLPTSHIIEIMFKVPPDFPSGGILNVPGIWMKQAEQTQGTALAGRAIKVTTGHFLIGLSRAPGDNERNIQLLRERPWFDIPIVYSNNRRAILAMEKGTAGERAFEQAFASWEK
jgi:hypothetical protein